MRIDSAGWPFIGGAIALALIAGSAVNGWAAAPFLVLAAFFVFFFRDPERSIPATADVVLSPADGRVLVAGEAVAACAERRPQSHVALSRGGAGELQIRHVDAADEQHERDR